MAQAKQRGRRRLPLSARSIILVLFAALIPLAAVVGINDYFARGTLLNQGHAALSTDANAKATLIQTYIHERLLDGQALASLPTAVGFLVCVESPKPPAALACDTQNVLYKESSQRALAVGIVRDSNYTLWSIYDATGHMQLTSSPDAQKKAPPPTKEDLDQVLKQGKQWVSAVYYDSTAKHAFVRLFTPIKAIDPQSGKPTASVLGFLQATLRLDYIWNIVKGEHGLNGDGSYAFMTDDNGIVIADSNQDDLFSAVRPLDAATQNQIASEKRFGTTDAVQQRILPGVDSSLNSSATEDTFEGIAQPGSSAQFQFVRVRLSDVPWSYFVLSPVATVTRVADDQIRTSLLSAGVIAILAVLIGLFFGSRITRPVRGSVSELQEASAALKDLASRQESSASEQHWVVDACRTGLESIRYLSDAMNQAARRIIDASNWFNEYWDRLTEDQARRTVQHLMELAHYIDEAARRQQASNDRMDKAITVTQQVSDQLVSGASAANRSAGQLEQVVDDLQHLVGGRNQPNEIYMAARDHAAPNGRMQPMGPPAPMRPANGQMGGQMMRAPQAPVHFGQMDPRGPVGPASQMDPRMERMDPRGRMGPASQMGGPAARRGPGARSNRNAPSQYGPPDGYGDPYGPGGPRSRALPDDQWGAPTGAGWDDR